jgi:hypothetical protein
VEGEVEEAAVAQVFSPGSCSVKCWGGGAATGAAVETGAVAASVVVVEAAASAGSEAAVQAVEELPAAGDTTLVTTWTF